MYLCGILPIIFTLILCYIKIVYRVGKPAYFERTGLVEMT